MAPKKLMIDYSKITDGFPAKRKLRLASINSVYLCPVSNCLHSGFKSKRGCRKHVSSRHDWYYFFENEPNIQNHINDERKKQHNKILPPKHAFSVDLGLGRDFRDWMASDFGGGRSLNDSKQTARRAMKFLLHASGTNDSADVELSNDFIDMCLGSALIVTNFLKTLQENWQIGHAGCSNYLTSLGDLMDWRKSLYVSNECLRNFTVVEIYIRRGKRSLSKKIKADWGRNFCLENLIAKNNWATLDEMETVVPFHLPQFKVIVDKCQQKTGDILPSELTFATRFITVLLFLRVKCSRPMTFQHLTVEMVQNAKNDGGFVDQRNFKTEGTFMFDSLLIDENVMRVLDLYIDHCRPLLNPACDYLLITSSGKMCQNLCYSMTILVFEAIQKYINPTRYRQIVETASSDLLTPAEQDIISQDQKHASTVAKVYYKKKLSREVAEKGKGCMEKMTGESRKNTNNAIDNVLADITRSQSSFNLDFLASNIIDVDMQSDGVEASSSNVIDDSDTNLTTDVSDIMTNKVVTEDLDVKVEAMTNQTRTLTRFSDQEDSYLSEGIRKYGSHNWVSILKDEKYSFNKNRSRDSLRVRASSVVFKRKHNL